MNTLATVVFVLYALLCLYGFTAPGLRAWRRRRARRRSVVLLTEYSAELLQHREKLDGYAELSRWVTANMLLASHRQGRRGIEARA